LHTEICVTGEILVRCKSFTTGLTSSMSVELGQHDKYSYMP